MGTAPKKTASIRKTREHYSASEGEKTREAFLEAVRSGLTEDGAARKANCSITNIYQHRARSPTFSAAWDDAKRAGLSVLLDEALRRSVEGYDEPVWFQGEICGHVRRYSDRILTHLIGVRLGKLNATPLKLPAITDAASIASALAVITGKIAAGELDLNAANSLLETHRKAIETVELEARIERLEAAKGMLPRIEERDEPEDG
jgi:hypothetical protein